MKEGTTPSLLLLPPAPRPANRAALNAAYRPSLKSVFSRLKQADSQNGAILVIALVSPVLQGQFRRQKSLQWSEAQSLLAGLYSIISAVCAELKIDTVINSGRGAVDTRIVLIDHDLDKKLNSDFRPAIETNNTIVVDLGTFVSAYHPWSQIFGVDTEAGHHLLSTYLGLLEGVQSLKQEQIVTVEGGLTLHVGATTSAEPKPSLYDVVCLGGTFDHLHPGHKLLLTAGALLLKVPTDTSSRPCRFIIGITGDELLKNKKYAEFMQSWEDRALYTIEFLKSLLALHLEGWKRGRAPEMHKEDGKITAFFRNNTISIECVVIQDTYGPTITIEAMDALVVSGETRSGGAAVNDKRKSLGWHSMEVFEVDVLDAEDISDDAAKTKDFATKISSTSIRRQKAESLL
ncbi:cytidylyltransferase [Truncatella angustata]|uniref:Cytidylyltransferase n=1 Tax=Truncatella angustata TaxID=152316 RepID=A0A9P8RNL5_9PEZI|nr:cytidylyltransferase [Truncatella angustata]KAH6647296.1 cytidylyltransferase [Truncatella angustata]